MFRSQQSVSKLRVNWFRSCVSTVSQLRVNAKTEIEFLINYSPISLQHVTHNIIITLQKKMDEGKTRQIGHIQRFCKMFSKSQSRQSTLFSCGYDNMNTINTEPFTLEGIYGFLNCYAKSTYCANCETKLHPTNFLVIPILCQFELGSSKITRSELVNTYTFILK